MAFLIIGVRPLPTETSSTAGERRQATAGLQCQFCFDGAVATIQSSQMITATDHQVRLNALMKEGESVPSNIWTVRAFWPEPVPSRTPDYLPEVVERAFIQGESNLGLPDHDEAATTMFRRALDVGLKNRFPGMSGDLNAKIKKLAADHVIPQSLADWAHEVRMIGNEGAHDLEGCTRDDAVAARDFVDALLRYLFSLPGMIEARRPPSEAETDA